MLAILKLRRLAMIILALRRVSPLILPGFRWYSGISFLSLTLLGCRPAQPPTPATSPKLTLEQVKAQISQSPVFAQNFTGFALYDPDENKMLIEHHAAKYFIAASNTKIFTFYAGLKMLPDSLPALKYIVQRDSLFFWGTGDPTFLHPDLANDRTWQFLRGRKEKLFFSAANFAADAFGLGWSWDDYNYYYAAERAPLPIYGNTVRFRGEAGATTVRVQPRYFRSAVKTSFTANPAGDVVARELMQNQFTFYPRFSQRDFIIDTPFKQSPELLVKLLSDTLHRPVRLLNRRLPVQARTLYATPADSLYRRMMQESDNMFAEHLLFLCAATRFDTLQTARIIDHVINTYLLDLPDRPIWVDGSGLSRFNLMTPRSLTALWQKIYREVPRERLFSLLAGGGQTGTFKNLYPSATPFVFGKSGTLSNTFNQSGFLATRSGKTYIFAFMNNNYTRPTAEIRREVTRIITDIHLNF